jgi:hypothetical protein
MIVFLISVVLIVLSLIAQYASGIKLYLEPYYWALIAWIVLAAGNLLKGV